MNQTTIDLSGLTAEEAARRLSRDGPNELEAHGRRTLLRLIGEVIREPMLMLLLAGGLIYLLLGSLSEALVLIVFASLSIIITVIQEQRTERVLDALREMTSPRALVIRDNNRQRIAGRDVVEGDLVVLAEGDRVPADGVLLEATDLMNDESLLTGESVPVSKMADGILPSAQPQASSRVYSGTLVVRGQGLAHINATGVRSEIGKIGKSLANLDIEPPRLQRQIGLLVRRFAIIGGFVSLLAVLLYGMMRGNWLEGVLAGIALGMSMLPEEFPMVLTVFMAMGAWRISKARVLMRRSAAIETLGAATVLCTDKTGTLTENRMSIQALIGPLGTDILTSGDLDHGQLAILETGMLASSRNPHDPMEIAFLSLGAAQDTPLLHPVETEGELVRQYGLRPDLLAVTQVWQMNGDKDLLVAAKGAPEAIATLCGLDAAQTRLLTQKVETLANQGLRVLAIAKAKHQGALPETPETFAFQYLGLVGLADPLRAAVPQAIAECRTARIRVVMITGDYPATAMSIARLAGIETSGVLTGAEMLAMSDSDLKEALKSISVFARIMPDQKLRLVETLKANGEIVAMTGDGVNDAPSIKAAHIGIAMGGRGTDVAREASSMVLLDDDFSSIVRTIRLGRQIYDNLVKAMEFILAVHVPIAGLALLPLVTSLPVVFGPMHIAFLEMVIDPVCSLVFEAERAERDTMNRPPRNPDAPLFSWRRILWSVSQGLLVFVMMAGLYLTALARGMPVNEVRSLTFFATVFSVLSLIFVNRSFSASLVSAFLRPNRALIIVLVGVLVTLTASLTIPLMTRLFRFGPLHWDDLLGTLSAGIATLLILEAVKRLIAPQLRDPEYLPGKSYL